jgi:alginate O-acetyltransferase complex protein AlgJ
MPQRDCLDARNADGELTSSGDLRAEHIESVFLEFLGRSASPHDVSVWMGVGSVRALIDGVLASEEYASRVAKRTASEGEHGDGPFLNCWTPDLERFSRPVGCMSPDGVTIVGARGHLFLYGGSNNNLAMYRGEIAMATDWPALWSGLVDDRLGHAQVTHRSMCCLVVPDKLAVYADLFPHDLDSDGTRPVLRLIKDAGVPLIYPCDLLRDARAKEDTYMLTDSHLTGAGNRLLAEATIKALGASSTLLDGVSQNTEPRIMSGDLGQHFTPPIVEINRRYTASSAASIIFDNWSEVSSAGGHIGTLRIFRRDDAPDGRTVVVFGDSYGFGDEAYPGLSWFLAQAFREVHFVWAPFGWDPDYLDRVGAELVVCQTAERFIARVPRPRIDVRSLTQETLSRGGALGLERIFGDVEAS